MTESNQPSVFFGDPKLLQLIEWIKIILQNNPSAKTPSSVRQSLFSKNNTEDKENAAKFIQQFWRLSVKGNSLTKGSYYDFNALLPQRSPIKFLSAAMFGNTVADTNFGYKSWFPQNNPKMKSRSFYHRDDMIYEKGYPSYFSRVVYYFDNNADAKRCVPITRVKISDFSDLSQRYLSKYTNDIEVITNPECENLFLIKIADSVDAENFKFLLKKIAALGIKASLWELSQFYVQFLKRNKNYLKETSIEKNMQSTSPPITSVSDLHKSDNFQKLSKIAINKNLPIYLLAASLYRLLDGLPLDLKDNENILNRIALSLSMAVNFYRNNYEKFAFSIYQVVHDISLLLYQEMKNEKPVVTMPMFKKTIVKFSTSALGINLDDLNMNVTVAPALSGMHAFVIALEFAKKLTTLNPSIKIIGELYFEMGNLLSNEKVISKNNTDATKSADIYLISTGPIVTGNELAPAADINIVIEKYYQPNKDMIIIVDATTDFALNNLKLSNASKNKLANGNLSILVNMSHQKFGLIHTDQAQFGSFFAILGAKHVKENQEMLSKFNTAAEYDLTHHLDMQIGTFIYVNCYPYLNRIFDRHFHNGEIYKNLTLLTHSFTSLSTNIDESLKNRITDFPEMAANQRNYFTFASKNMVAKNRDSFGHWHTSICAINGYYRISPGATDLIDTVIELTELFFVKNFTAQYRISELLKDFFYDAIKCKTNKLRLFEEIILVALIRSLQIDQFYPKNMIDNFFLLYAATFLKHHGSDTLRFRAEFNQIYFYLNGYSEIKKLFDVLKKHLSSNNLTDSFLELLMRFLKEKYSTDQVIYTLKNIVRFHKEFIFATQYLKDDAFVLFLKNTDLDTNAEDIKKYGLDLFALIKIYLNDLKFSNLYYFFETTTKMMSDTSKNEFSPDFIEHLRQVIDLCENNLINRIKRSGESHFLFFSSPRSEFMNQLLQGKITRFKDVEDYALKTTDEDEKNDIFPEIYKAKKKSGHT